MHHKLGSSTTNYNLNATQNTPMTYVHPWYYQQQKLASTTICELESTLKPSQEKTGRKRTKCRYCGHPELAKDSARCYTCKNFMHRWGFALTPEDREFLNANPNCGICGSSEKLRIDHCHETNEIRGHLCLQCNTSLGNFGDNLAGLERAVNYLHRHALRKETREN